MYFKCSNVPFVLQPGKGSAGPLLCSSAQPWKEPSALEWLLQQIPWHWGDLRISADAWSCPWHSRVVLGCSGDPTSGWAQGTSPWGMWRLAASGRHQREANPAGVSTSTFAGLVCGR